MLASVHTNKTFLLVKRWFTFTICFSLKRPFSSDKTDAQKTTSTMHYRTSMIYKIMQIVEIIEQLKIISS
jgi:hypothetical protein